MPKIRKDNKGRNLRPGETQRSDGSYMFVYKLGKKKKYIYDSDLAALRVKEKQLTKDADDGIRTQEAMKITLNDMLTIIAGDDKPIKCVYEGDPIVVMGDPLSNGDLTQEYLYGEKYGMGIVLAGGNAGIGRYEIA